MKKKITVGIFFLILLSSILVTVPTFAATKKVKKIAKVCEYVDGKIMRKYMISYNDYGYISSVHAKLYLDGWEEIKVDYSYEFRSDNTPKKLTVTIDGMTPNGNTPIPFRYRSTIIKFTKKGLPKSSFGESESTSTSIVYKKGLPSKATIKSKSNGKKYRVITLDEKGFPKKKVYYNNQGKIDQTINYSNDYEYYKNNVIKSIISIRKEDKIEYKTIEKYDKFGNLKKISRSSSRDGDSTSIIKYTNTYKNDLLVKQTTKNRETTVSYTSKKYYERFNDYKTIQDLDNDFWYAFG